MSDSPTLQVNPMVLGLVAVVAVLLVAITWILVGQADGTSATVATTATDATAQQAGASGAMQGGTAPAPAADFDPSTATQVPEGISVEDFTATYYEALLVGDYETAYRMTPAHKQTGTVADFQAQIEGYGITDYTMLGHQDLGEQYIVGVDQVTGSFGTFENQWTFINVDGVWLVQDKAVTAMK